MHAGSDGQLSIWTDIVGFMGGMKTMRECIIEHIRSIIS